MKPVRRLLAEGPDPLPVKASKPDHFRCQDCGRTLPMERLGTHPRQDACNRCSPLRHVERPGRGAGGTLEQR